MRLSAATARPDAAPAARPRFADLVAGLLRARPPATRFTWRARHAAICLLLGAVLFNNSAGLIAPDTKLDLAIAPGHFLARALHLWDAQGFSGQLQNQAYGYLFPMGPFFTIGHAVGLPAWVVQRLWWAVLLCAAYLGVVTLARRLGIGTPWTRVLAGAAYACSPHILTLVGGNSVEILPMCVAPWVVVPLVEGVRGASPRRCGLGCGVAILCMGGVNAAADFAAVLPAALWLLTCRPSRGAFRLAGWAVLGGLLATLWWAVPLLVLGSYSPPFLDYIENARTTTATTSLIETLRGTADWVAYLGSSGARAGLEFLTSPALIVESSLIVALGLAALSRPRMPHRVWLVCCLALGLVAVTLGHGADPGSIAAGTERGWLDGALAPLRNLHKFDVLIRLPLVLGLAHAIAAIRWGRRDTDRRVAASVGALLTAIVVIGTAAPLVALRLSYAGEFASVPVYWTQTAAWLHDHQSGGRALLVPASRFGDYVWGRPADEPLQSLARSPWDVRNTVPLTPGGHVRMLDALEQQFAEGRGSPALAAYLRRAGIGYLVVRNDLDRVATQAPQPALVHALLAGSAGLSRAAGFGPLLGGVGTDAGMVDQGLTPAYQAVEIWRVTPSAARATVVPASSLLRMSGGPEALLQMPRRVVGDRPTVLSGDPAPPTASVVLTDTNRRREANPGGPALQRSDTLTATGTGVLGRRRLDYLAVTGTQHQSVVRYLGADDITASSSAADADNAVLPDPSAQPYSAFDRDPRTAWRTAADTSPVGQWLEIRFDRPTSVRRVTLTQPSRRSAPITVMSALTSTGSIQSTLPGRSTSIAVPPAATTYLRLRIDAVTPGTESGQAALSSVVIPGVSVERTIVLPNDVPSRRRVGTIAMSIDGGDRSGCVLPGATPVCAVGLARAGEDDGVIDRMFTLPVGARYRASATVRAHGSPALDDIIDGAGDFPISVQASSRPIADPLTSPQNVVDGDQYTGWVARASDRDPTLTLRWHRARTIRSLHITMAPTIAGTRPDRLVLDAPSGSRTVAIPTNGRVTFAPVRTDRLVLHLSSGYGLRTNAFPTTSAQNVLGIGVGEVSIPGVASETRAEANRRAVHLPCGGGPDLSVDGALAPTALDTTVGALRAGTDVALRLCGSARYRLVAGAHHVLLAANAAFDAATVTLTSGSAAPSATTATSATVATWGSTDRSVRLSRRAAPVLLIVNENVNPGWRATASGHEMRAVTIDGWRQGYLVPAGAATTVHLAFAPQRTYLVGLLGGGLAVLLLLIAALLPARRKRRHSVPRLTSPWIAALAMTLACVLCGGVVGAVLAALTVAYALVLRGSWRTTRKWIAPSIWITPSIAFGAALVAGLALAAEPFRTSGYAANTAPLQILCLIAVSVAGIGALRSWPVRRSRRGAAVVPPAADGRQLPVGAAVGPAVPRTGSRSRRRGS